MKHESVKHSFSVLKVKRELVSVTVYGGNTARVHSLFWPSSAADAEFN